jgi:hypothetical protein
MRRHVLDAFLADRSPFGTIVQPKVIRAKPIMIPVRPSRAPTSPRTFTGLSFQRSTETGSNAVGKVLTEEIGSNPIVRNISRMLADVSTTTASPSTSGAGGLAGGGGMLMLTVIPATDPNFQYIGRMQDGVGGAKMFDMPGCEIRTRIEIAAGTSPPVVSIPGISASVQTCLRADVFRLQRPLIRVSSAFICHGVGYYYCVS